MNNLNTNPAYHTPDTTTGSGIQPEAVYQLLYISAALKDFTEDELAELLVKARANNESMGISGMMLYHEGSFIQALEGDEHAVNALYNKIAQDERHTVTYVMFKGMVTERDFEGWSMGFYRSNQTAAENLQEFYHFMAKGFRSTDKDSVSSARQAMRSFHKAMQADCVDSQQH